MRETGVAGYTFLEKIGVGAESVIYRAREESTGKTVAVKHLVVSDRDNLKYLRHVENEFRILSQLRERGAEQPSEILVVSRHGVRMNSGRVERDTSQDLRGALQPVKSEHFAAVTEPHPPSPCPTT